MQKFIAQHLKIWFLCGFRGAIDLRISLIGVINFKRNPYPLKQSAILSPFFCLNRSHHTINQLKEKEDGWYGENKIDSNVIKRLRKNIK